MTFPCCVTALNLIEIKFIKFFFKAFQWKFNILWRVASWIQEWRGAQSCSGGIIVLEYRGTVFASLEQPWCQMEMKTCGITDPYDLNASFYINYFFGERAQLTPVLIRKLELKPDWSTSGVQCKLPWQCTPFKKWTTICGTQNSKASRNLTKPVNSLN